MGRPDPAGYPSLWGAAVHEAGHAIVAVVLGLTVTRVTVRPAGSGEVLVAERLDRRPDTAMLFTLAGPVAQVRLAGGTRANVWSPDNPDGDGRVAIAALGPALRACWPEYARRAAALVDDNADAILSLARELFAPGRVMTADRATVERHYYRPR
jgi:hypothetical protein